MQYRMKIVSEDPVMVYSHELEKNIHLEVGRKYICYTSKPTTIKEKENQNRIVEILGFTDDFEPHDAIVRYSDNNRRGRIKVNYLLPYNELN